jgi:hypothetical protein
MDKGKTFQCAFFISLLRSLEPINGPPEMPLGFVQSIVAIFRSKLWEV